jgi:hypothetical protein
VTRSSLLVVALFAALFAVGCKDKAHPPATKETPTTTATPAAPSLDALATVQGTGPKVLLDTVAAVVEIKADGSVSSKGATVALPSIAKTLGLPEIAKRRPSAFAADGATGSGSDTSANPTDVQFAQLGHPEPATSVPVQTPRVTTAFAIAHPFDVSAGVVVFADAKAPATALVDVLAATGGFIAVKRGAELGALPFAFDRQEPPFVAPNRPWLELRLGKPMLLAVVPGLPMQSDMNKLDEVIKGSGMKALDILVAADSTVADVVAAAELARGAGIDAIGLGRIGAPNTPETMTRDYAGPRVLAWDFFMQNQDKTDPTPFHTAFDATLAPVHACYEKALGTAKDLGGTGRIELVVETTGKVADLQATGVPKPLAACASTALGKAAFPPIATPVKITAQLAFVPR